MLGKTARIERRRDGVADEAIRIATPFPIKREAADDGDLGYRQVATFSIEHQHRRMP